MVKITKDLVYDQNNNLKFDVYEPDSANHAAIIVIHGGGWWQGDKSHESTYPEKLASDGFLVFVPNYRLAPAHIYPAAVDDMTNFYQFIKQSTYEFDREKIAVSGMSSGGELSVELSIKTGIPAVSWSGILDLDDWISKHPDIVPSQKTAPKPDANVKTIDQNGADDPYYKWFVLNYVDGNLNLLKQASPIHRVSSTTGPIFMANSLREIAPTSGVEQMQAALADKNVPSETMFLVGARHGEVYLDDAYPTTLLFLKKYLGI